MRGGFVRDDATGALAVSGLSAPAGYLAEVLADSPSGYWRLGDAVASGSAAAEVGTAGTVAGTVTFGVAGALASDADTAAQFNGANALINTGAQYVANDKTFSHECWFKTTVGNTNLYMTADTNTGSNNQLNGLSLQAGKVQAIMRDDANVAVTLQTAVATYNDNAWHHAVMTCDGTTLRLYVDGAEANNGAISALGTTTLNASAIGAGRRTTTGLFFSGVLDEVAVYPAALSAARVLAHHEAGVA